MDLYFSKNHCDENAIVVDDMFLTKDMPTTAGSKMLEGYMSLFDAEVVERLTAKGYKIAGKAAVGEFALDVLGETSFLGACEKDCALTSAAAEIVKEKEAKAALVLDVNGSPRRGAAQKDLINLKPTYGTVSRFGTVSVACSGECVGVTARCAADCKEILDVISGHDDKDGTSLSDEIIAKTKEVKEIKKVAVLDTLCKKADGEVNEKVNTFISLLNANGVAVERIENEIISVSRAAWNVLMSAEACNNVSRFDGVKYGYRTKNFTNIDELYTGSRTEAFGKLIKKTILFGSETLSTENYFPVYDKAMRTRRVVVEEFNKLFESYDAVLLPAASTLKFDKDINETLAFEENVFTAPATLAGLPALTIKGVQVIGKAFGEGSLISLADTLEKEAK